MSMTAEEIQALREKTLKALAQPESVTSGDKSVRNRSANDTLTALSLLEREAVKVAGSSTNRAVLIQTSRG